MYKSIILMVAITLAACGKSNNNHTHGEEAHDHGTEAHAHESENLSHDAQDHGEEAHDHETDAHNHENENDGDAHEHDAEVHNHETDAHDHGEEAHDQDADVHDHGEDSSDEDAHDHGEEANDLGEEAHDHGAETQHDSEELQNLNLIHFDADHFSDRDFSITKVNPTQFSSVIQASGEIMAVPGEKRHLASPGSGTLHFIDTKLVQGTAVRKGQPLFIISPEFIGDDNVELRYNELQLAMEKSRSVYLRHRKLNAEEVISDKQLMESKTIYTTDSIRFYNLAGKASASGLKIIAPIDGYIHALNFAEGQYVSTGEQIITISSNNHLLLRADVPMQFFMQVKDVVSATFRTAYAEKIYRTEELQGELLAIGSAVLENDHYIPVYFEVWNDGSLLEGAFAEFSLITHAKQEALVVPAGSLLEEQGNFYVYVRAEDAFYEKRAVRKGESNGLMVEIIDGLYPGEEVVSKGVMLVKAASMVTSGGDGHNHAP